MQYAPEGTEWPMTAQTGSHLEPVADPLAVAQQPRKNHQVTSKEKQIQFQTEKYSANITILHNIMQMLCITPFLYMYIYKMTFLRLAHPPSQFTNYESSETALF